MEDDLKKLKNLINKPPSIISDKELMINLTRRLDQCKITTNKLSTDFEVKKKFFLIINRNFLNFFFGFF